MSVTTLIGQKEVRDRLKGISPSVSLPTLPLLAAPLTANYGLVGTAFDYALRFELQRRNPHAKGREWVGEHAKEFLPEAAEPGMSKERLSRFTGLAAEIVGEAKAFVSGYVADARITASGLKALATHSIGLAKLDLVFRARHIDPNLDEVNPDVVRDVVHLLKLVPYQELSHPEVMMLNPTFGVFSHVAGGADADLITGDLLVDFKTVKNTRRIREMVFQLLAYLMLARRAREEDGLFPQIDRLGIYFSRQAYLWTTQVEGVTSHTRYSETEDWFIHYAEETEMDPDMRALWRSMHEAN